VAGERIGGQWLQSRRGWRRRNARRGVGGGDATGQGVDTGHRADRQALTQEISAIHVPFPD
jgi:hypothetical protein